MSKKDDVSKLYYLSNRLDVLAKALFFVNVIASLISLSNKSMVVSIVVIVQIISVLLYFSISAIDNGYFWFEAEKARRKNSIENGYGVHFSELETEKYYNNGLNKSLEKCAMNSLESNYFTKVIAGKMILPSVIESAIAFVAFLLTCRFIEDERLLLIISQTFFSSYILGKMITLILYKLKMEKLYKEGFYVLITRGVKEEVQEASLLVYVVEYETIKAYYKIRLSNRVYLKMEDELGKQWEQVLKLRK